MKTTFLTRLFYPHIGGVETHVLELSKVLIKQGHEVVVITEQYEKSLFEEEIYKGIHIYRIPVFNKSEKDKKFAIWQYLFANKNLLTDTDIIHVHDVFFWIVPLKLVITQPMFTTFHGWEGAFPPTKSAIHQRQLAVALSSSTLAVGDYISNWYQIRPNQVIYGATNQKPLPLPKKPHILVYGRLSRDNDSQIVVSALEIVKKELDIPITFLGDGEYKIEAKKVGKVLGFKKRISQYLKASSHVISSSYLSMIDSMAAGRPVFSVYSNLLKQDYLRLHPQSENFFITKDEKELSKHLISSINQPKIHVESIKIAQKWALEQTWQSIAEKYLSLWQKALQS